MTTNTMNKGDICLADSATTHTILKDKKYFSYLITKEASVITISGSAKLIEGSGRAIILFPGGTQIHINDALYSSKSTKLNQFQGHTPKRLSR